MTAEHKDTQKLEKVWNRLKDEQESSFSHLHKSKSAGAISGVKVVEKDGEKKVEVSTVNGGKILDDGSKSSEFKSMKPEEKISSSKLDALIQQVLNEGWATTVDDLTPEVVTQLRKACDAKGIKTFGVASEKIEKEQAEKAKKDFIAKQVEMIKKVNEEHHAQEYKAELAAKKQDAERVAFEILQAHKKVEASHRHYDNSVEKMKNKILAQEKKRCDDYLKDLRDRTFEKYIADTREQLFGPSKMAEKIAEKQQKGMKLTAKEQELNRAATKYGLNADPKKDTKSHSEQKKAFALKDLGYEARKAYDEEAKYYKGVYSLKAATLERNAKEIQLSHMKGENIEFTEESFREFSYRYMPTDYHDKKAMAASKKICCEKIDQVKGQKKELRMTMHKEVTQRMAAEFSKRGLTVENTPKIEIPLAKGLGLHGKIMQKHQEGQDKKQPVRTDFAKQVQAKLLKDRLGR